MVWWYDCVKVVPLLVVDHDHVYGGWSCTDISRVDDVIFLVWFVGGLVIFIWICWYIYFDILNKVWIIKINDKKQYKTINNNKKQQ